MLDLQAHSLNCGSKSLVEDLYLDVSLLQAGHICDKVVGIAHIFTVHRQDDSAGEVSSGL